MKLWHPLVGHHLEFHHRLVTRPVKFRRPEQTDIVRTTLMPHQVVEIGPQGFSLQVVEDSRRLYIFAGICKKPLLRKQRVLSDTSRPECQTYSPCYSSPESRLKVPSSRLSVLRTRESSVSHSSNLLVRFGTLSARDTPRISVSSPFVAAVWRRARYAIAARAGCRLPRSLNSDCSIPYSAQTTSLTRSIDNPCNRRDSLRRSRRGLSTHHRPHAIDELLAPENPAMVRLLPRRLRWLRQSRHDISAVGCRRL